jgi:hypothetical protein
MSLARLSIGVAPLVGLMVWTALATGAAVNESARQIPVAEQVDVVVVGGSTGAVAAAVAAAQAGAKVFLAAPYTYLGDDMTATLRLWLEPGEVPDSPLARQIFTPEVVSAALADPNRLAFTYTTEQPGVKNHRDTQPPSRLTDGQFGDPTRDSVEFRGDATVVADLGQTRPIAAVRVMAYQRETFDSKNGFRVQRAKVFTSNDGRQWQPGVTIENRPEDATQMPGIFVAPLAAKTRWVKFVLEKDPRVGRLLLGELQIFAPPAKGSGPKYSTPRPMQVKKALDAALLAAGVKYLYSCYATDVLRDATGQPCGIVIANRAGRQAVVARVILDATPRAAVARLAGAQFRPYPVGQRMLRRVVIGGEVQSGPGLTSRTVDPPFYGDFPNPAKTASGVFPVIEYTLQLNVPNAAWAAWAAADQQARTRTYHPKQQFTADELFEVPPDPVVAVQASAGPWQGAGRVPLEALRPKDVARLYVLGGCADVPRAQAERLLRPVALMGLGARVGRAAAEDARATKMPQGVCLPGQTVDTPAAQGEVRELLAGTRPVRRTATIPQQARALPVLGTYDVVVIGGGTAGAPAGIGAARQGAKTLLCEYLHGLGGVGTVGAISGYYWGNRVGFTGSMPTGNRWVIEEKMEWYRSELLKAGADVWFGTIGCGAFVENGRVAGAVVATPQGRGVVLAKVVIDTTGNADVAAAAGAECQYTDHTEFGMQGTGLPPRNLGATYANTDFTITDETDMVDIWQIFVAGKDKYAGAFDQGQLIDTRERRRIVGDFTLTLLDEINERRYPDTLFVAFSNFDSHGYTVDPYLLLEHPDKRGFHVHVPLRAMLPKGLENILVGGLGLSAHRDALPLVRMQADLQNQGYGLGVAAAMASKSGTLVRNVDIRALQRHLIQVGNLPESVLTDVDSYPLPVEKVAAAVKSFATEGRGAAVIMARPEQSLPLLRKAYAQSTGDAKLTCAKALAVLGDASGLETLLAAVNQATTWDAGWNYRSMGQFGHALSPLDTLLVALGRTHDRRALPAVLAKLRMLTPTTEFSHHRAVGLALELLADPAAAEPLAKLLAQPGMTGYMSASIADVRRREQGENTVGVAVRREAIRELLFARALYRCGDYQGKGEKILRQYTHDLRGHLARHAQAVLDHGR